MIFEIENIILLQVLTWTLFRRGSVWPRGSMILYYFGSPKWMYDKMVSVCNRVVVMVFGSCMAGGVMPYDKTAKIKMPVMI